MEDKDKYKIRRLGTPLDGCGLPEGLIKDFRNKGIHSLQGVFGLSVAARVGEGLNEIGEPYGLTHQQIHDLIGNLLSKEEVIRLCSPIPKYGMGCSL